MSWWRRLLCLPGQELGDALANLFLAFMAALFFGSLFACILYSW